MRELRITDAELQKLIAPALLARLTGVGFEPRASEGEHCAVVFPIVLNFSGVVTIERSEDGVWTFRQEQDAELGERTAFSEMAHAEAIRHREAAPCR